MQDILIQKLYQYIRENNPDLLLQLEEAGKLTEYLSDKISSIDELLKQTEKERPAYIIEEICFLVLTRQLRPSKFNYVSEILEEEFGDKYKQLKKSGILTIELINLIILCNPVFEDLNFSEENEDNAFTRYAITGCISEYFENNTGE